VKCRVVEENLDSLTVRSHSGRRHPPFSGTTLKAAWAKPHGGEGVSSCQADFGSIEPDAIKPLNEGVGANGRDYE
jgi:hypothetical protein